MNTADHTEYSDRERLVAQPVVSVLMLAYNHGPGIAEAIESVLAQRGEVPYELIIGEDCSTDDTRAIALDYQQRHPDRIRVICPHANSGMAANLRRIAGLARGEFVAYCEGDDYWCRDDKLSSQVALLRADEGAALVHADWVRARRVDETWQVDWEHNVHRGLPRSRLAGDLFPLFYLPKILRTCTVLHRRSAVAAFYESTLSGHALRFVDTAMSSFLTSRWRTLYWPCVAAVYRESPNSALRSGRTSFMAFLRSALEFDTHARQFFRARGDYPVAYRWECDIGLLLGALRLRDKATWRFAIADLRAHYDVRGFFAAAWQAVRLRLPSRDGHAPHA